MRSVPPRLALIIPAVCFLIYSGLASAQQTYVRPLVSQPVNESQLVRLKGNTHPLALPRFDVAAAPADLPMQRMMLILKRSPDQEADLLKLLDNQQDKSSASYHKWLTPEQFGQEFGPADADIQAVTTWLQSNGFQVAPVSKGRVTIEFSGSASQVQQAFHTAIHKYQVNGQPHWANANDPEIPAALAPVIAGVHSLHNFYATPQLIMAKQRLQATVKPGPRPQVTFPDGTHALVPSDYGVIYNAAPILTSGINGQGETIAVVARSNLFNQGQDVTDFRSTFGVCCGTLNIVLNGADPGDLGGGEEGEATLDASWSGALAPSAQIDFVVSAGTNATDGIFLSEAYIVDNNFAPVMTESFGGCEAGLTSTQLQGISSMAEQAAAQGITYILSSGDTGAEGCDNANTESVAQGPVSVSALAATPFTVAVGGTSFNENGHDTTYWNTANGTNAVSAKSYIPENVWNESCSAAQCGSNANISAGGGGASSFFDKPSWQSGVAGIPSDGVRDIPDVSLTAAGHDPYLLCLEGSCTPDSQGNIELAAVSGTSASAPSFAGIMALVNHKTGARQGQANYVLYRLAAAETLAQCNGSLTTGLPASTCIFNDVTVGNNAVPGEIGFGTPGAKYQSTTGYDLATGLGSVNVTNLINQWSSVSFRPTTTTLTLTPPTFAHGASASVSVTVVPNSGTGTPTGDVSLQSANSPQGVTFLTLGGNGDASGTSNDLPGGTYAVHAHYAGDGTFAPSDSAPTTITVSPEGSTTALAVFGFDQSGNLIALSTQAYGLPAYLRADVSGASGNGVPTGNLLFKDNGTNIGGAPYALNSEGTATTAQGLFTIPVGSHAIVAQYQGDSSFTGSSSSTANISITQAPTATSVSSNSATVAPGAQVTLTATVNTASGGSRPSGTVTFLSGGVAIAAAGNPAVITGTDGSGNIQNGAAQAAQGTASVAASLPAGQNSITAQYSGDTNYIASTSAASVVTVQADFAFAAANPSITIASPGSSGTAMLTVTGQTGYNSTINFSAASCSGLPRESTCSFSPASVTGSGSTTLTITTTAAHSARLEGPGGWTTTLGLTFAGVLLLGSRSRRAGRSNLLSLIAFAFLITIAGCGGGGSGGSSGSGGDPGTPAGTSTITVTATSGALSHTATVTLKVQ